MSFRDAQATALTNPLSAAINDTIAAEILTTQAASDIRVGCYLDGLVAPAGWEGEAEERLWNRAGQAVSSDWRIDYGTVAARFLLSSELCAQLMAPAEAEGFEFAGLNAGGLLGGRGELGYDPPSGPRGHVPHGGRYRIEGVRAALESMRASADAWLAGDAVQEHLVGSVDIASQGGQLPPGFGLAREDAPAPPLWAIVYGERSQAGRLIPPLTTLPLSSNLYHPYGDTWTGLSDTEWNEMLAYQIAAATSAGHLPTLQMVAKRYAHRLNETDAANAGCAQLLEQCLALLRADWAPEFAGGQLELPLVVQQWNETSLECGPECGGGPQVKRNPLYNVRKISPVVVGDCIPPGMSRYEPGPECSAECSSECSTAPATTAAGWGAPHHAVAVPCVLPSLWRQRSTGNLLLLLVNWTSSAASSRGTFAPWLYRSWGGEVAHECSAECDLTTTWSIARLSDDGSAEPVASGLTDAANLICHGTSGAISGQDIELGMVPAYFAQAYRITQD